MGWSFMCVIAVTVLVNFSVMIALVLSITKNKIKQSYAKRKYKRYMKKAETYAVKNNMIVDTMENHNNMIKLKSRSLLTHYRVNMQQNKCAVKPTSPKS